MRSHRISSHCEDTNDAGTWQSRCKPYRREGVHYEAINKAAAESNGGSRGQKGHNGDNCLSAVVRENGRDLHDAHHPAHRLKTVRWKAGLEADDSVTA